MARLSGRVAKLERLVPPGRARRCGACGLRHARPLSIEDTRGIMGGPLGPATAEQVERWRREHPHPGPLCLCDCCADRRLIAEWSHRTYRS